MRRFQTTLLVTLALLMPLRGLAAATMEFMPAGSEDQALHAEGGCHQEDGKQAEDTKASCACVDHSCCASFLAPSRTFSLCAPTTALQVDSEGRPFAGFVPDHLDPPPLVL